MPGPLEPGPHQVAKLELVPYRPAGLQVAPHKLFAPAQKPCRPFALSDLPESTGSTEPATSASHPIQHPFLYHPVPRSRRTPLYPSGRIQPPSTCSARPLVSWNNIPQPWSTLVPVL